MAAAGRDVQRIKARTPKTAFVGQIRRDWMAFDQRPAGREDLDQWAGAAALPTANGNNISFGVETHSLNAAVMATVIRTKRMQQDRMIERTIIANWVGAQFPPLAFARLAVGDVKRFLIRRQQHSARADRVMCKPGRDKGAAVIA